MLRTSLTLLSLGVFASFATSQTGTGPGMIDQEPTILGDQPFIQSTYFTGIKTNNIPCLADITKPGPIWSTSATGLNIQQVSLGKTGINGLQPGEFHMCMTIQGLSSTYTANTSASNRGVILGKVSWNTGAPVFTPYTTAYAMSNPTGSTFGLMIDGKDGKLAAVDWSSGVMLSWRPDNSKAFPAPVKISTLTGIYVDPCPAYVDGNPVLFFVAGTNIVYAPLSLTYDSTTNPTKITAASTGTAVTVASIASSTCHSPTPVVDQDGNAIGMWFANVPSSDSDMYFIGNLTNSKPFKVWDNTTWMNNGGIAGGRFLAANSGNYNYLLEGQGFYMCVSSDNQVGSTASIDNLTMVFGGQSGKTPIMNASLAMSAGEINPISLGGILGQFALNPTTMIYPAGSTTSINADDVAYVKLAVPPVASLKGVSISFQAVMTPIGATPGLTCTATANFK